jgi:4-hydroxy-3-methylbut-2-enyl diphosphate reductase
LQDIDKVGVTAGASAPAVLIMQVVEALKDYGGHQVIEHPGKEESIVFAVPIELR